MLLPNENESIELSPGFFDPRIALSDDEEEIVPLFVNIEKSKKGNVILEDIKSKEEGKYENIDKDENKKDDENIVVKFMYLAWNVKMIEESCGCSGGWSRTFTY